MKREAILDEMQAPELELRVFYGPQAGSRLSLAAGHYLLGSSDECTIILNGPRVESEHALIDFDDSLPCITPMNGKVSDAQGNPIEDRLPMSLGMPLEIGGIWIAIDYIDSPWPDPASVAPISTGSPVEIPEVRSQINSEVSTDNLIGNLIPYASKNKSRIIFGISVSVLFFLFIAGAGFFAWSIQNNSEDQEFVASTPTLPIEPHYLKKLRNQLDELIGKNNLSVTFSNDGLVKVNGYVDDLTMKTRIENILTSYNPPPASIIYAEDELLQTSKKLINENISANRAKLKVENISGGTLIVNGAVASSSIRDEVVDLIKSGVPGITQVNGSITLAEDLPLKFEEEIANTGLTKRFQVISKQPEYYLRGKLTENELNNWEKLLARFTDNYGNLLPIRANIAMLQTTLPVNVETIVGGVTPFVVTKKGERIERGGDINGNVLTIVKDTEIIFDGNERFRIGR